MPHIEGHGDPFQIRPLNQFSTIREWLAQFGLDAIQTAIILGGNADATAALIDNLVAQGRLGETEVNALVDFHTTTFPAPSRRGPIGVEARGARELGLGRLFSERREVGQERRQDILGALGALPGRDIDPEEIRRRAFRLPEIPAVPELGSVAQGFVRGLGSANLQRFAQRQIPGLTSQFLSPEFFQQRRQAFQSVRGFKTPEERKQAGSQRGAEERRRQTAFFDPASIQQSFRASLERFPFLERFMSLPPEQRGRDAKRFAPRTRRLRF